MKTRGRTAIITALLAPGLLFAFVFRGLPLALAAALSLFETNFLETRWVGFENYSTIFGTTDLLSPILNTGWYILGIVPAMLIVSLLIAMVAARMPVGAQHTIRFVLYIPSLASGIVIATVWRWIFHYDGIVNWIFGREVMWFATRLLSVAPISFIEVFGGCGFYVLVFIATLRSVPVDYYDAARVEGASASQVRRWILLPHIMPTVGVMSILLIAGTLQIWGWIYMLAPYPYASTIMYALYREGFMYGRFGVSAAYSVILMAITIAVVYAQRKVQAWQGR